MNKLKLGMVICLALALLLTPILSACAKPPAGPVTIRLSAAVALKAGMPHTEIPMKFIELVDKYLEGKLKVELYGVGELYPAYRDMAPAVQSGELDMAFIANAASFGASGIPEYEIMSSLPYPAGFEQRWEDVECFLNDPVAGPKLHEKCLATGMVPLMYAPMSPAFVFPGEKITTLEGFKGKKFRSPGGVLNSGAEALGATAVSMPFSDFPMAMKTGVVDGLITEGRAWVDYKIWETGANHMIGNYSFNAAEYVLAMSKNTWDNKLTAEMRETITDKIIPELYIWALDYAFKQWDESWQACLASPGEVYDLPPQVLSEVQVNLARIAFPQLEAIDPELFAVRKRCAGL